jgi:hypothetical protein
MISTMNPSMDIYLPRVSIRLRLRAILFRHLWQSEMIFLVGLCCPRGAEGLPRKTRIETEMFQIETAALHSEQASGMPCREGADRITRGGIAWSLRSA